MTIFLRGLLLGLLMMLVGCSSDNNDEVVGTIYRVTFESTWSAETHPTDFPTNAHFSKIIGAAHTSSTKLWEVEAEASQGIQSMAETGGTSTLNTEVDSLVASGLAKEFILGPNLSTSPASTSFTVALTEAFPSISLVTMIAPSPDWFVGVSGLLLYENGTWKSKEIVTLFPYDAGTDSGETFLSSNNVTSPQEIVSRLNAAPFSTDTPIGTFTFELID